MSFQTALAIFLPLTVALAAIGSAIGLGWSVKTALESIARQPEAANMIQITMVIGAAFIEALTIYALLTVLILQGKIG